METSPTSSTVPDAGTYWYHSHVGTQLDRGLYGPLIIEDRDEKADYDEELVVVLDDWIDGTGTNPDQVLENLRKNGMKPMEPGGPGVTPTTPLGADGGDVTYPYFVINGRVPTDPPTQDYLAGQRIRLRVINAGSDTTFRVAVPDTDLNVIATDGYPVMPVAANSVILGMGERVDAIFTVNGSVPVVAVPYGKPGHAQLNIRVDGKPSKVERRRLRRGGRQRSAARHRDAVADTGGDASRTHTRPGDRGEVERSGAGLHVAVQRQAL